MYFQINVTPKAQKSSGTLVKTPEVQAVLVLAPFQPQPRLNIESTVGVQAETSLIIRNTSNRSLNVKVSKPPPEDRRITLSTTDLSIPPESELTLWLTWTPSELGSWRDTLQLTDSRRLKYDIPLTTISLAPKKSSKALRPQSQKILAPSNDNHPIKTHPEPPHPRKQPQKLSENKENSTQRHQITSNTKTIPENSILNISNHQNDHNSHQNLNISGVFNISSFQLTPLKPSTTKSSEKPLHLEKNPPDFDFSPRDTKIISPGQNPQSLDLRRDTYINQDPKFCRLPPLEPPDDHEENFDDSLSPRPEDQRNPNFSALMNNLASFTTPQKSDYLPLNSGLTVTKTTRTITEEFTFSNNTFEISGSRNNPSRPSDALDLSLGPLGVHQQEFFLPIKQEFSSRHYEEEFSETQLQRQRQSEVHQIHDFSEISNSSRTLKPTREYLPHNYYPEFNGEQRIHQLAHKHDEILNFPGTTRPRRADHPETYDSFQKPHFNPPRHSSVEDFTNFPSKSHPHQFPPNVHHHQQSEDHFLRPTHLLKSFGRLSPVIPHDSSVDKSLPISSSPLPSIRTTDSSSVQQVIEADLWLKDEPRTPLRHQKSISLESIPEEESFRRQSSLPQLNITKTFKSPLKPTVFEISPTKKPSLSVRSSRLTHYHKISPRKPGKITKDRIKENNQIFKKTKMHLTSQKALPGVRISKLSLSKLHKPKQTQSTKEKSIKLHNPNDLIFNGFNPDPFAATMTEDPFLASTLYYDEKWMWNQEVEFKKWLNALLTPPEHLNADVDTVKVDVGKVWQSCRSKETIPLAETREAVSGRYFTNHRLNTLRKAALVMFNRPEVKSSLSKTILTVEKGNLVVRQDKDLHRDIGLQKEILELFLSYNPLWLRIGLEVIYGETIPLSSNNDLVGLTKFLINRFFNDPFLADKFSHQNCSLKTPNFMPNLNKFILKKFLLLVYFLDYAKRNKLIGHDPCLFHKKAVYKESREILLNFSRQTLSGVGDITKMLKPHGYVVSHKQTYLDEYDYAVKDLAVDLRDGVRLCRVMELIIGGKDLTAKCRVPAISRLQKVHNVDLALSALHEAGYVITGDIDAKTVADGHREKTLSLLWQIIYKFQAPRFEKAAKALQKWWRAHLIYILVRNYLRNRKRNAAIVLQCCWRSYRARKTLEILKKQKIEELRVKTEASKVIQTWWRSLKDRRSFLRTKNAAMILQKAWRRYRTSKPYLQELQRKKQAAVIIQKLFKSYKLMKIERNNFLETRGATLVIQRWYKALCEGRKILNDFQNLKKSTIFIQRRFRANKSMKIERDNYLRISKSVNVIQKWWRGVLLTKKTRNEFIIKKHSVKIISDWLINTQLMKIDRKIFLGKKNSAIIIQRAFRRFRETEEDREYFKSVMKASVVLQTWWRQVKTQREFEIKRKSVVIIQNWYRSVKITEQLKVSYLQLKSAAIMIQKTFKMKKARRNYLLMKKSISNIVNWYLSLKNGKLIRNEFLKKRNSIISIQRWFRSVQETRRRREVFLEMKKSAIVIQKLWRSKILMRKSRNEFFTIKEAVIKVQAISRGILARRRFKDLQQRQKAAVILQRRWRARKLGEVIRRNYLNQRNSVVCIQRRFRGNLAARKARNDYLELRNSVMNIQKRFRALKMMQNTRKSYLNLKKSTVLLQSFLRMKKALKNYQKIRKSVIAIQTKWRSTIESRRAQNDYLNLKKSTIFIQRRFRTNFEAKKCRNEFLNLKLSAIFIQRTWRAKLMSREREEAAIVLQTWWRSVSLTKKYRQSFKDQKKAAVVIQQFFRSYKLSKSTQDHFTTLKMSTIIIQRSWRRFCARRRRKELIKLQKKSILVIEKWWNGIKIQRKIIEEEKEILRRCNKAAGVIQAAWRGHHVRKEESMRIKELRERSKRAAAAAVPSTTVAYRLKEAMNGLMTFSNVGQLSMCLACIDTLTRLSIRGCIMFCELELVEKIYDLLEQSNRSLPWMDVCLRCTNILITLAKLPDTAGHVRKLEYMETVARLMNVTVKGQVELFLNLSTLLWVLVGDEKFKEAVVNDQRTVWLIKSACNAAVKKEGRATPAKRKNTSMERIIVLPNAKPDWGLTTRRPRCFVKVEHAVFVLMEKFGIQSFGI